LDDHVDFAGKELPSIHGKDCLW